jgi:hypothetical protein
VRGGNFDENLVYVNDIPIYRPFLANSGRQEGLSFVNPSLVKDIDFYAGGWESKYGDKLSSSLNISYKEPESMEGGVSAGLLGGSAYLGGVNRSRRVNYLVGMRYRDSRYLLRTLEVEGEYFPTFADIQSMISFDLTRKSSSYRNRTKLNWLSSISSNRYLTQPTSQFTEFGSFAANFRLQTAFIGQEILNYDTYQTGFRLSHWFNEKLKTQWILSGVYTRESEDYEVEGGYRLCDVDNNPDSRTFESCLINRGIGTQFDYGRNDLEAQIYTAENRYEWISSDQNVIEWGGGVSWQEINDEINEYSFVDSADFVTITYSSFNALNLSNQQFYGYLQDQFYSKDSLHEINAGVRLNYWTESGQLLISPRIQYRFKPNWQEVTHFNFSVGSYQQHPFYRELRNFEGGINQGVSAQRSIHVIGGVDRYTKFWSRPFLVSLQAYYKHLTDLVPYDVDNLRLRYFAENNAEGYATGLDVRINGEFIKGTQSWISLGYLRTREDIAGDNRGFIRRPLDQRINFGLYFEDHMPGDPSVRVYVQLNFGSGYPFGPPESPEFRNVFSGDEYYRADVGLSKLFEWDSNQWIDNLELRLEVLNALGADNTLSYTWIQDVNGTSFAIPNSLSARFFNLKAAVNF